MAVSGFEGFEKRLELHFTGDDPYYNHYHMGLRLLEFPSVEKILHAVQCTVVSAVGNAHFDSYVLSESSLFIYPKKIVIKTCGTTQLLKSIRPLITLAAADPLRFRLTYCKFTRGTFIFPQAQPFPHSSFKEEVVYIESTIPSHLRYRKASVMAPSDLPCAPHTSSWHVFVASDQDYFFQAPAAQDQDQDQDQDDKDYQDYSKFTTKFTVEICMTDLDPTLARNFFQQLDDDVSLPTNKKKKKAAKPGDMAGRDMTEAAGIQEINPKALICDYGFDPCGYSMNGLDGPLYSTIHVTPEDGYSYASFEFVGLMNGVVFDVIKKVVNVFRPGSMSIATTTERGGDTWREVITRVPTGLEMDVGMTCMSCCVDDFPGDGGTVVFQTFTTTNNS